MIEWGLAAGAAAIGAAGYFGYRRKGLHRWLPEYIRTAHRRSDPRPGEPVRVLIAVCDHYEPKRGGVSRAVARGRVQEWLDKYPKLFDGFRDSSGRPPQHTFFYPEDEYESEYVDMLAGLCRQGYGEVEVHLHHDHDTADGLRNKLLAFKEALYHRHGLLSRDKETGDIVYGFIHGNWCLDNSRSDGRYCGVDNELEVLRETGCYADFTMPSAPSETQTRMINSLYWAVGAANRRKSHNSGVRVGEGPRPDKGLLMIQGPLVLDWSRRKLGVFPTIENGNLQKSQPPCEKRLALWLRASVKLGTIDNLRFVKLHTHGVNEPNQQVLLGESMVRLHQVLRRRAEQEPGFEFHYVTAREMANVVMARNGSATDAVDSVKDWRYVVGRAEVSRVGHTDELLRCDPLSVRS